MSDMRIAFSGLGAMGRRMAQRLIDAGYDVVVWSRSGVRDEASTLRARAVGSPRIAARGAAVVISMVRDDDASAQTWGDAQTGALGGLDHGAAVLKLDVNTLLSESPQEPCLREGSCSRFVWFQGGDSCGTPLEKPRLNLRFAEVLAVLLRLGEEQGGAVPMARCALQAFEAAAARGEGDANLRALVRSHLPA